MTHTESLRSMGLAGEEEDAHWLGEQERAARRGSMALGLWVIRTPLTDWGQEQLDHIPRPERKQ